MKHNNDIWDRLIILLLEKGASLTSLTQIIKPLRGTTGRKRKRILKSLFKTYSKRNSTFLNETYLEGETEEREQLLRRAREKLTWKKDAPLPW